MSDADTCWICDDPDVAYVDVLGMGWCDTHFAEDYWGLDNDG